jgi:hypothetical protein
MEFLISVISGLVFGGIIDFSRAVDGLQGEEVSAVGAERRPGVIARPQLKPFLCSSAFLATSHRPAADVVGGSKVTCLCELEVLDIIILGSAAFSPQNSSMEETAPILSFPPPRCAFATHR